MMGSNKRQVGTAYMVVRPLVLLFYVVLGVAWLATATQRVVIYMLNIMGCRSCRLPCSQVQDGCRAMGQEQLST